MDLGVHFPFLKFPLVSVEVAWRYYFPNDPDSYGYAYHILDYCYYMSYQLVCVFRRSILYMFTRQL